MLVRRGVQTTGVIFRQAIQIGPRDDLPEQGQDR